jgi:hypothetical protein
MKGFLFGGCSFTWGQGLYFYSGLNRVVYPLNEFTYKKQDLTDAHKKFKDSVRYPRLVANHFNSFESFKNENGGSEDETFDFFDTIFSNHDINYKSHLSSERYNYDDFEYMIVQLSQIHRNKFYFNLDGVEQFDAPSYNNEKKELLGYNTDNLLKYFEQHNLVFNDYEKILKESQITRLKKEFKFYEEKGIKTKLICWTNDLLDYIKNDEFLNEKLIPLSYNNKEYETIELLQNDNKELRIKYDYEFFGENTPDDHHPSLKCHQIIADSIIKIIEPEIKNEQPTIYPIQRRII